MSLIGDLSLAYKTPLRIVALVVLTALLVTGALVLRERDELRRDLIAHSQSVARVLANTLVEPIAHDDVWRAYEIIRTPFNTPPRDLPARAADVVMVLDPRHMIYVSTRPVEYPMLGNPAYLDPDYAEVEKAVAELRSDEPMAIVARASGRLYMVQLILADGVELGTLVMAYPRDLFQPRFLALVQRAAVVTGAVLAVLLPAGWYWGGRVAQPLVDLAGAMGRVGSPVPADAHYVHRYRGRDEIGRLGLEFQRMLGGLREKQALEQQVIAADRLAAIGRLTAGIAHEINNPLGGMLNALSTFRRHGSSVALTNKTLSLIERGLLQIKDTVGALLVEARVESHALTRQDIEDTHTLIAADAEARAVVLEWHNEVDGPLRLPSTQVRQVLINLLLNAVHAAGAGGRVRCRTAMDGEVLCIEIANDGAHIEAERLPLLFEPFALPGREGHGLGLWVTYQIVQQLGGHIGATSRPGRTQFTVVLPLQGRHETEPAAAPVSG